MKVGIYLPKGEIWGPSYRFMKMFKEGIEKSGVADVASEDEIARSHNNFVPEVYRVLETGLHDDKFDTDSLEIETKDVYRDSEVDEFLADHEVHLEDRMYYDADQRFITFDTATGKLTHY